MSHYLQITTTTGTRTDAERIAHELVARRLAACVQVSGPILSTYWWEGKFETADEWRCTMKTRQDQLALIERALAELHPYQLPELIATPIVGGSQAYLAWLDDQLPLAPGASGA